VSTLATTLEILLPSVREQVLEVDMPRRSKERRLRTIVPGALAVGCALVLGSAAQAAATNPVTLRCTLRAPASPDAIIHYYTVDSERKTISTDGSLYHIGADPSGSTGHAITRWSDTQIVLVNEEWYREGWQRFRIVTVLDRLTGGIRSEDGKAAYTGTCAIADVSRKLF
jgi:hypothetical protein